MSPRPETDAELVVELVERTEDLLSKVQEVYDSLITFAVRHRMTSDMRDELNGVAHILEGYVQ